MADEQYVKGIRELGAVLQTVPVKVERNVLRGALRAGMSVIKPVAQSNIHNVSGLLAKGLKIGTRARGGVVTSNLKAIGPHGFVAPWIEYGVKPHLITAKRASALSFGGTVVRSILHPGFAGRGFMRNALQRQSGPAVIASANYMKVRLATKHGLDTAHIQIEGDE